LVTPIINVLQNFSKQCETPKYQKLVSQYLTNMLQKQRQECIEKRQELKDKSLRADNLPKLQLQMNTILSGEKMHIDLETEKGTRTKVKKNE